MSRVVIFPKCGGLLLSGITRDEAGRIKTGHVVNGGWNFEVRAGEQLAKAGNAIQTRWPDTPFVEIEVPATMRGDYNAVIGWAEKEKEKHS
jgi:hypothetical protein